ncbi:MAG: glutamate--tRNA ligase, partial [Ginsengibacter sp.]
DGSEQEIFSLQEMVEKFSMDRVHSHGAKFDFEKAKWFNHEWIKNASVERLIPDVKKVFEENGVEGEEKDKLEKIIALVKDRCVLLNDFWQQAGFFFIAPGEIDTSILVPKWDENKNQFFVELIRTYSFMTLWNQQEIEHTFKEMAAASRLKPGDLMFLYRIMLVGGKFGPGVFDISSILGREETMKRIEHTLSLMK